MSLGLDDNSILFFQFMVSTKSMEILVKLFHPYSHRHSLLVMEQIQFHPGVLLWNPEQQFTFDLGRFFLWNCLEIVCKVQNFDPSSTYNLMLSKKEWKMGQIFVVFSEYLNSIIIEAQFLPKNLSTFINFNMKLV